MNNKILIIGTISHTSLLSFAIATCLQNKEVQTIDLEDAKAIQFKEFHSYRRIPIEIATVDDYAISFPSQKRQNFKPYKNKFTKSR